MPSPQVSGLASAGYAKRKQLKKCSLLGGRSPTDVEGHGRARAGEAEKPTVEQLSETQAPTQRGRYQCFVVMSSIYWDEHKNAVLKICAASRHQLMYHVALLLKREEHRGRCADAQAGLACSGRRPHQRRNIHATCMRTRIITSEAHMRFALRSTTGSRRHLQVNTHVR